MLVGIDEAGRGCWAGPLVAAAVALPITIHSLKDSKQLSAVQRAVVLQNINESACIGIGMVDARTIDQLGLTKATTIAMTEALQKLQIRYTRIIIDGNYNYLPLEIKAETLVRADGMIPEVSAASIVAKEYRDSFMKKISNTYPEYGFEKHVGYGTEMHRKALFMNGPTPLHRLSYKPVQAARKGIS
jgi:ribonuclease HII